MRKRLRTECSVVVTYLRALEKRNVALSSNEVVGGCLHIRSHPVFQ